MHDRGGNDSAQPIGARNAEPMCWKSNIKVQSALLVGTGFSSRHAAAAPGAGLSGEATSCDDVRCDSPGLSAGEPASEPGTVLVAVRDKCSGIATLMSSAAGHERRTCAHCVHDGGGDGA